ncbi:RAD55 family ATPase [Halogranum rubrum]|uniref:KaiA binding protein n=1 Tax=Halogranum salarium B-1 TaxID=1210908 RepID=J2ZHX9_9EURY|nr:ATPase domain-containing protein [Halogranum salarium]EJN60305.1 KaiA binding protein [Halogranum salarium B-1]
MRIDSGVDGFDELVGGGIPEGRLYLLSGPPGSGKTTFSAQFITRGAMRGEKCLYISMHETRSGIASDMEGFDFGFKRALGTEGITFLDAFSSDGKRFFGLPGERRERSSLSNRIVSFVQSRDIDRLVIDSTMLLRYFLSDDEDTLIQFLSSLKRTNATTLLISEMTDPSAYTDEHYLAHGVIFLHNYLDDGGMTRGIQVVKMRGTDVDTDINRVEFTDEGLHVHPGTPPGE